MQGRLHESGRKQGRKIFVLGLRKVSKSMCSLEGVNANQGPEKEVFQRYINQVHKNSGQSLLKAKITF